MPAKPSQPRLPNHVKTSLAQALTRAVSRGNEAVIAKGARADRLLQHLVDGDLSGVTVSNLRDPSTLVDYFMLDFDELDSTAILG